MYTKEIEIIESELSNIVESQIEKYVSYGYVREGPIFSNNGRFCQTMIKPPYLIDQILPTENNRECHECDEQIKSSDAAYKALKKAYGELIQKYEVDKGLESHIKKCWDLINGVTAFDSDGLFLYDALVWIFERPVTIDQTALQTFVLNTTAKEIQKKAEFFRDHKTKRKCPTCGVILKFISKCNNSDCDDNRFFDKDLKPSGITYLKSVSSKPLFKMKQERKSCPECNSLNILLHMISNDAGRLTCHDCDHRWRDK